jgi:Zn ribbon nucleic-acid-binding protein
MLECRACGHVNKIHDDYEEGEYFFRIKGAFVEEFSFKYGWEDAHLDIAACPKCGTLTLDVENEFRKYKSL